jgi:hypothetical protein
MWKFIKYGLILLLCYSLAFCSSARKIVSNTIDCTIVKKNGKETYTPIKNRKQLEVLNECVMKNFNPLDRFMYPQGLLSEGVDFVYD